MLLLRMTLLARVSVHVHESVARIWAVKQGMKDKEYEKKNKWFS